MLQRLIFEGANYLHFISNLAIAMNFPAVKGYEDKELYRDEFTIVATGKQNISKRLKTILELEDLTHVGIILDTDKKTIEQNWQSISSVLKEKYAPYLPQKHDKNGTVIKTPYLTIGIWMMPDNEKEGYLEHFFEELLHKNDEFWQLATQITEGFVKDGKNRFKLIAKQKADVHTWLAWQKEPESPMGFSLNQNKEYFDLNAPIALKFKNWWKNTFELVK